MDPAVITKAAQDANSVGLLTWLVSAITLFCGALIFLVMHQNYKREERYAKIVELHIPMLGDKIDAYKDLVKEKMGSIEESNRAQKVEHQTMTTCLNKVSETLISLAFIMNANAHPKILKQETNNQ